MKFSTDGKWIVSGGRGQGAVMTLWKQIAGGKHSPKGETIRLWRASDGKLMQVLSEHLDDVWAVDISPDGRWLVSNDESGVAKLWRLTTTRP